MAFRSFKSRIWSSLSLIWPRMQTFCRSEVPASTSLECWATQQRARRRSCSMTGSPQGPNQSLRSAYPRTLKHSSISLPATTKELWTMTLRSMRHLTLWRRMWFWQTTRRMLSRISATYSTVSMSCRQSTICAKNSSLSRSCSRVQKCLSMWSCSCRCTDSGPRLASLSLICSRLSCLTTTWQRKSTILSEHNMVT